MTDVFVSYKAEDRARIAPLVRALEADGVSVWWDAHIGGGDDWRETISSNLDQARWVIVVWSNGSVGPNGRFVRDEATRALRREAYIPIRIDDVEPPLGFGETQALDLQRWRGSRSDPRYRALLQAVRRAPVDAAVAVPVAASKARVDRRTVVLGTAAASIAGIGVGGWALFKPTAAAASDSIAVLPFENLSGDPRESYFSDGVAEEIRSSLMRIGGLKVVGRTSSEAVRNDDAATVARKLDVANILTGSVRQSPSTIRVTAELVDGRSGIDRWSQDYDRPPGDTIKIQTDIAENVAGALSEALGRAARAAISVGGTQNVQAQRLFIQAGAVAAGMVSKQEFQRAFQLLDSAISLDPNYAAAYALKSRKLMMYSNNYANGSELARDRAESLRLARIALKLAPNLASAHQALGDYYSSTLQIAPGIAEFDRALRLAPADADVLTYYSLFRSEIGDANGALELVNRAIALDPLNQEPYQHRLIALFNARRFEDVVSEGEQLQRKSPELFGSAMTLADSLVMLGRFPEAERFYATADADFWHRLTGEAVLLARAGDKSGARRKLQRLQQVYGGAASTQYAEIYAQLGDVDQAFAALDAAYSIKDGGLQGLRVDPFLDPLRSDPRFQAIVRRMNFPT